MNRQHPAFFALALTLSILSTATGDNSSPSAAPDDYGQAVVEKVLRVDSQCRIFCDIQNWPPIIAKEIPLQIRGLDAQQSFDLPTRQFILETLTAAMNPNPPAGNSDPNQPSQPKVLLKHIQRGQTFCLIADVEINGQDLAQILVDKGYAKKIIIPNGVSVAPASSQSSSPAGGFVASKSGKVFHKSACPHAKRIQDNTKVTYRTREEATAAGKRPCQTCNP
jgi:micrococcal nuclease